MKILVTGSQGLIGNNFCNFIEFNTQHQIFKIDKELGSDILDHKIQQLIMDYKIDIIYHFAAHPGGLSFSNSDENIRVNLLGLNNILKGITNKKTHLIFSSSSAVYGNTPDKKINEKQPLDPTTIYAINKVASENLIKFYSNIYNFKWTICRLFATYGSGHKPNLYQGIVNVLLTQIMNGDDLLIKGSLKRKRDLMHADDAVNAFYCILQNLNKADKKIYNIGSGNVYSINEIILTICNVLGKSINNINVIVEKGTFGDPLYSYCDNSRAIKELNFKPLIKLEEGLKKIIKDRQL